jgi:hypothetical protein
LTCYESLAVAVAPVQDRQYGDRARRIEREYDAPVTHPEAPLSRATFKLSNIASPGVRESSYTLTDTLGDTRITSG